MAPLTMTLNGSNAPALRPTILHLNRLGGTCTLSVFHHTKGTLGKSRAYAVLTPDDLRALRAWCDANLSAPTAQG